MDKVFSIPDAIGFGWTKVKEQLGFFIGFTLLIFAFQLISGFIQTALEKDDGSFLLFLVYIVISTIIGIVIGMWQVRIVLDVVDGKKGTFGSLQNVLPLLGKALVTQILYTVIIIIGLFLLIVPGIIWIIKYQFAIYYVIDKNMSPFEALEASGKLTSGEKWHLLLFNLVIGLVVFAGVLALGVGLLIAIPIVMVAPGYVYRQLQKRTTNKSQSLKQESSTTKPTPA